MRGPVVWCGLVSLCVVSAVGQTPAAARCSALAGVKLDAATVTSAELVAAGAAPKEWKLAPGQAGALKEFCRVRVTDRPSVDSDTAVEVWLPASGWNGRYRGIGNGGFAGEIYFGQMATALGEGYATSGTNAGHNGASGTFALGHPEKVKDFGWRAVHDTAVAAKGLIRAFYGKPAQHAYFTACSDGGREALMEAQRFPADYDGILAGAPAFNWTGLIAAGTFDDQTLMATPASYLPARKLPAITEAVLQACDAQDGVKDGVLNDPRACKFDPEVLACKAGDADRCLMPEQVKTLETLYADKRDAAGKLITPGYLPGAEAAAGSWAGWQVAAKQGDPTLLMYFGVEFYQDFVYEDAGWKLTSFELDRDYQKATEKTGQALNAVDTNLKPFTAHGGKLILYHGWNDPAIPGQGTVAYYDAVAGALGSKAAAEAVRLYMVPGMLHCGGGPGATEFGEDDAPRGDAEHDVFTALEQWVEAGKAPGTLVAKGAVGTRPICVYPAAAKYLGGDTKDAKSFACVAPGK